MKRLLRDIERDGLASSGRANCDERGPRPCDHRDPGTMSPTPATLLLLMLASCGRTSFDLTPAPHDAARGDGDVAADAPPDAPRDAPLVCGAAYQPVANQASRYRTVTTAATWYAAQLDCESDGGHLPIVDDEVENAWLASQAIGWLGLTDHRVEGDFRTVTGSQPVYTNWSANEPNDSGGSEDCAGFYVGPQWNDFPCRAQMPYTCECDLAPLPFPAAWCETGLDASCDTCDDACAAGTSCSEKQLCEPI
jgi:hypothetical protein